MLHVAFGYGLFTGGLGFHDGAERIGMTVVPVSSGNTARHHLLLQDFRPHGICGTPSFVLHIAESLAEQGGDPRALGLRYGMFGAEPWTEGLRIALERAFGLRRLRHLRAQRDRRARRGRRVRGSATGLHVCDDHFLPEIIDPATGRRAPPGQEGSSCFTTLTKRAIPMVRYRTGDITTLDRRALRAAAAPRRASRASRAAPTTCSSSRASTSIPPRSKRTLLAVEELQPHYLLVVDRSATLARLEVQVEPGPALLERCGGFRRRASGDGVAAAARAPSSCARRRGLTVELDDRGAPTPSRARKARRCACRSSARLSGILERHGRSGRHREDATMAISTRR